MLLVDLILTDCKRLICAVVTVIAVSEHARDNDGGQVSTVGAERDAAAAKPEGQEERAAEEAASCENQDEVDGAVQGVDSGPLGIDLAQL